MPPAGTWKGMCERRAHTVELTGDGGLEKRRHGQRLLLAATLAHQQHAEDGAQELPAAVRAGPLHGGGVPHLLQHHRGAMAVLPRDVLHAAAAVRRGDEHRVLAAAGGDDVLDVGPQGKAPGQLKGSVSVVVLQLHVEVGLWHLACTHAGVMRMHGSLSDGGVC